MTPKRKTNENKEDFPQYCDYFCKHAEFADPNAIGACRKNLAVWCSYFERYNNKNNKCFYKNS